MRVALTIESSSSVENQIQTLTSLSKNLIKYFSDRDYGNDVKSILLGVILVEPQLDKFYKVRKPRYTPYRKYLNRDRIEIIEDKVFTYDVKIEYKTFKSNSDEQNKEMVALQILESLSNLDKLPKEAKDFDKERFKSDLKTFFENADN